MPKLMLSATFTLRDLHLMIPSQYELVQDQSVYAMLIFTGRPFATVILASDQCTTVKALGKHTG